MIDLSDEIALASHVGKLVEACEAYSEEQQPDRTRVLEMYDGDMSKDLPVDTDDDGKAIRSAVVSSDIRSSMKKIMPSVMRTLLGNDQIVEYVPVGPGDEEAAEQATQYVNHVVIPECGAEDALYDAIFDANVLKTGIIKWVAYQKREVNFHDYSGQPEEALLGLEGEPDTEILDLETAEDGTLSFRVKRIISRVEPCLEAIPRGSFLIAPNAKEIEDSPIVAERQEPTRSELVSRGYDKADVDALACYEASSDDNDDDSRQGDDYSDTRMETTKAMETVLVYEAYVRLDMDEDGIAELYKIVLGDTGKDGQENRVTRVILEMEPVDEAPYAKVVCEREAHQFEGHSIAEDQVEIQRVKTVLLRQSLDNIYGSNIPQPVVDSSSLTPDGLDAVMNPMFGRPVQIKPGANARDAVNWLNIPFIADKSYAMLNYMDQEGESRTGITDQSGGVDPEAFQNMSATGAQLLNEKGVAQAAMMIRTLARGGIKKAFKGLLKLVIAHSDKPRTVRLRGKNNNTRELMQKIILLVKEAAQQQLDPRSLYQHLNEVVAQGSKSDWVDYDPRVWNAEMDCVVNVGLGAGSRERDLNVLQMVYALQKEIILSAGADNPFVKPDQLYNTLEKIVETAGLPNAEPFFTKPDPQEVAQKLAKAQQGDNSEQMKMQMHAALEREKTEMRKEVEAAQMEADLVVKQAELEKEGQIAAMKAQHDAEMAQMKAALDFQKHRERLEYDYDKLDMENVVKIQQPIDPDNVVIA